MTMFFCLNLYFTLVFLLDVAVLQAGQLISAIDDAQLITELKVYHQKSAFSYSHINIIVENDILNSIYMWLYSYRLNTITENLKC